MDQNFLAVCRLWKIFNGISKGMKKMYHLETENECFVPKTVEELQSLIKKKHEISSTAASICKTEEEMELEPALEDIDLTHDEDAGKRMSVKKDNQG
ncbi:unnamed protein product [Euphydryas editha]|uniref:Uncharacterized protein n=1 Tax=Euphydryas editha TaxID=104508 RepID=A0AAU9TUU8_EUPED|nr:unnamed protein product [Euphydryas editha]